eukprot:6057373-Amphidinium_carterae.3
MTLSTSGCCSINCFASSNEAVFDSRVVGKARCSTRASSFVAPNTTLAVHSARPASGCQQKDFAPAGALTCCFLSKRQLLS